MKIAAICTAPNHNTGMMFVDRALYLYLGSRELIKQTTFFSFQMEGINSAGFSYKPLTSDIDLKLFDYIIIWGDFIVSDHFLSMMKPKIAMTSEKLNYDLHSKVLMAGFSESQLKKVIVFGQCIFVDDRSVFEKDSYIKNLKRLLEYSALFKLRDPLSAYRAKIISNIDRDFLGVDAALLNFSLDKDRLQNLKASLNLGNEKNEIGLYFGRSKQMDRKKKILGYYLKYKLKGIDIKWIPWLKNKQLSKRFFGFAKEVLPVTADDYIIEILKSKLIITDTYHLSLLSWSLGVPCICFGNAAEDFNSTVHDKKKEIFFISNFITDYYLYNEKFYHYLKNKTITKLINTLLVDNSVGDTISKRIKIAAQKSIDELNRTLVI